MAAPPEGKQEHEREKLATEQNGEEENGGGEVETEKEGEPSDTERMARIHAVVIEGNTRTRDSLIKAEVLEAFRPGSTEQEFVQAATASLLKLNVFHSVKVTPVAGPPELPAGTTYDVVIKVVEPRRLLSGSVGFFREHHVEYSRSRSVEGSLNLKNLFGYGDIWDASGAYGWDQTTEMSIGLKLPRLRPFPTPLTARISLLSRDWLNLSSYSERLFGLSIGLVSSRYHDLTYNLTWRTLTDRLRTSSQSIRRQLGHSLLSSFKYTFKIDRRDSHLRPTRGCAFSSSTEICGLCDSKGVRFVRQEFDLRGAVPLGGFFNMALNSGVAAGAILPWGRGFMNLSTPVSDRFHIGGPSSPFCTSGGPSALPGFSLRGLGPTDVVRRLLNPSKSEDNSISVPGRDALGGDLAVTAFADLSFDLPPKFLREAGIYGHAYVSAGSLSKLSENETRKWSFSNVMQSIRSSAGFGIVIPTGLGRVEINYCHILKQSQHDHGKSGLQFSFS